ncbi:hypothetical protein M3Y98_00523300 [Aphelenchoides besseyi]|nr:hypothetical protein M3Y98_00523300 [Aphelenchoides besseyi]KAI6207970.1 hypothetical protein M3Y96_00065000 [Aphelenchoides besseyi]
MIGKTTALLVFALIRYSNCWHDERAWTTIVDGQPAKQPFNPMTFTRHPQQDGRLVRNAYAALYMTENRDIVFGQAQRESDGQICGQFNFQGRVINTCNRFRVLVVSPNSRRTDFFLTKPENFDQQRDEPVEYANQWLVVVYDPEMSASYFGTLDKEEETTIYAVDYNGAPTEIRGKDATSGDYVLYVVSEK